MASVWIGLLRRADGATAGLAAAGIAAAAMFTAVLAPAGTLSLPQLLVRGNAGLALDAGARPALLLFGGLWIIAGLLAWHRGDGRGGTALLLTLSAALTLALAQGEALIYMSLLCTGYGLYALLAAEAPDGWQRAGRALVVLLVISDLLIFETLVHAAAHGGPGIGPDLLPLLLIALLLRASIPPAHAWLPPALSGISASGGMLLLAVPTGAALFAAIKLLPGGPGEAGSILPVIALAGAGWALVAGVAQRQAPASLGYALAASAAALLAAFPATNTAGLSLAWAALAVLGSLAMLPVIALQRPGRARTTSVTCMLVIHGLAVMQLAALANMATPGAYALITVPVAVTASALLTLSAQRTPGASPGANSRQAGTLALGLAGLALAGLLAAWFLGPPNRTLAWLAPLGIACGLLLHRFARSVALPRIPPGDLLGPVESLGQWLLRHLRGWCEPGLSHVRDDTQQRFIAAWDGRAWALRFQRLELRLRAWSTTSLLVLILALVMAFLLAG
jgi:hypothetical protein